MMNIEKIVDALLLWYQENKRELPWRKNKDPYRIWISEIMLQQTRVDAVIAYYTRFMEIFPTVESLANAKEEQVLKLWEGLGYYSRARNLHKAAKTIITEFSGIFPTNYEDIIQLSGIGEYTAGAICSIAFEQKTPAIDGNVLRVMSRILEDDRDILKTPIKKDMTRRLKEIYPQGKCGDFTQALMELGALICVPNGIPKCEVCPISFLCGGYQHKTMLNYPVKTPKPKRKIEYKTAFILHCEDKIAVRRRTEKGVLQGLWELPNVSFHCTSEEVYQYANDMQLVILQIEKGKRVKHIFTHIEWIIESYIVRCQSIDDQFEWVTLEMVDITLPTAFRKILDDYSYQK